MSENNENKEPLNKNYKVPKLRFPKFNENWDEIKLKEIATRITRKNKENKQMVPLTISAQDGLISQYDYFDKKIASINLTTYYILKNGEFAYNKSYSNGYPYGAIKRLDVFEEGALSSLYICFCVSNIDSNYLCYYFDSNKWNYEVKIISGEGARNHGLLNLTPSDFFNIRIFKPHTLEEQCKISKFLELIYAKEKIINRKIDILKKYKEGLQKELLKNVAINSKSSLKNIVTFEPKSKIQAGDSIDDGLYSLYKSGTENGKLNTYSHDGVYIIANDGGTAQFKLTNGKFSYTDHCICFKGENDEETIVLCNYLQSLEKKINYIGFIGTGLKNIDRQYLGIIKYPIINDKKTIAKSFILIDRAIANLENKYNSLITIKKFMLNNLFI